MSTPSPTPAHSARPNIWQRIFDKLSGGPPNQKKLNAIKDKPWPIRYNTTLFMCIGSFLVLIAPEIVNHINGIPNVFNLQTLQVHVVQTREKNPHLIVALPDKSLRSMEWPVPISFKGEFRSYVWSDDERDRLTGCLVTVRGEPLRWTIDNRFRIWELDCPRESIHIGVNKSINEFKSWKNIGSNFNFYFILGFYLFIFVIYLYERRGNL